LLEIITDLGIVVLTDANVPVKKSKAELESLVKANGGKFYQTNTAAPDTICIADRSKSWAWILSDFDN
jgi:DNA ligase-4